MKYSVIIPEGRLCSACPFLVTYKYKVFWCNLTGDSLEVKIDQSVPPVCLKCKDCPVKERDRNGRKAN